jgi:hypothetical protein
VGLKKSKCFGRVEATPQLPRCKHFDSRTESVVPNSPLWLGRGINLIIGGQPPIVGVLTEMSNPLDIGCGAGHYVFWDRYFLLLS